jgi:Family of unknown function (DUF6152)
MGAPMHRHIRRPRRRLAVFVLTCLAVASMTLPAAAHHGWAGYLNEDFQISGTVESPVSVAGPHASMKIRVKDDVWDVVLAPPARTERAGLKPGVIPVGAQVTAYGHRHRDPKKLEIKTERVNWNGRLFNVYPDRS